MEKEEIRTNFIENIDKLMYERRKSQADVVRDTGIPQARMSTLLSNNKDSKTVIPTVAQLKALADYFGVSMDWLIENHNDNAANAKINEAAETKQITYDDVIKALLLIDEYCDLGFKDKEDEIHDEYDSILGTISRTFVTFDNSGYGHLHVVEYPTNDIVCDRQFQLGKFVTEWSKIKDACSKLEDKVSANKLYETWKNREIDKAHILSDFFAECGIVDVDDVDDELPFR